MTCQKQTQRERLLEQIRATLTDGHPNPEGYCEWLEAQPISKLRKIAASCPTPVRPTPNRDALEKTLASLDDRTWFQFAYLFMKEAERREKRFALRGRANAGDEGRHAR